MKRFEVFLGNGWEGWAADDNISLKRVKDEVQVSIKSLVVQGKEIGPIKTTVNLNVVPAYSIA